MHRHALTDSRWKRIQSVMHVRTKGPASTLGDRSFIDAVLYRSKIGVPWRDLPQRFRAIATRKAKPVRNYLALIHLACATMCLT